MKYLFNSLFVVTSTLCLSTVATGHYLWATIDQRGGEYGIANVYFEESPAAGGGEYIDHFATTSNTWIRTIPNPEPLVIKTADVRKKGRRWLQAKLKLAGPRSVDCYGKFGVYAYGKTNVLLHYYARYLDVDAHEHLHELGRAEQLELDIVPHDMQDEVELKVLWRGEPAAKRTMYIRGPKLRTNLKTDEKGTVRFKPDGPGQYTFRTSVEEEIAGRDGEDDYSLIRHNGTLVMRLPLQK